MIGSPDHPISIVRWGSATRFANWLQNGQPSGTQNGSTTEDGAYTLNGATSSQALALVTRNPVAIWFIPTENEWYKAAYYQPAPKGGDSDGYWAYPLKTNSVPYSDQPPGNTPDNTRVGNFFTNDVLVNGYDDGYAVTGSAALLSNQNYLSDVGAYTSSPSYYGTFDQGGNDWEWTETGSQQRAIRGGNWDDSHLGAAYLSAPRVFSDDVGVGHVGFRVASIPEPSTIFLAALATFGLLLRRKR